MPRVERIGPVSGMFPRIKLPNGEMAALTAAAEELTPQACRSRRKKLRLSVLALAQASGVRSKLIVRYEAGNYELGEYSRAKIEAALVELGG